MPEASISPVKLPLFSPAQERSGEIEVAGRVFNCESDPSILQETVRMQLANRRSGTASTKTRGFISGGGIKPWRQKHTGRARAGSTRSPLWRHGGTIFGPQPRDYSYKMPKKAVAKALCLALSVRARAGKLMVVESLELPELKTKAAKAALDRLGLTHALVVLGEGEEGVVRAIRNLAAHKVLRVAGLNVYDILNYDELLMTAKAARSLEQRLGGGAAVSDGAGTAGSASGQSISGDSGASESGANESGGGEVPGGDLPGGDLPGGDLPGGDLE
jgi:large subunit ribosomal protein L4